MAVAKQPVDPLKQLRGEPQPPGDGGNGSHRDFARRAGQGPDDGGHRDHGLSHSLRRCGVGAAREIGHRRLQMTRGGGQIEQGEILFGGRHGVQGEFVREGEEPVAQ